ncbi:hypothetical protein [Aeromonas veronii]
MSKMHSISEIRGSDILDKAKITLMIGKHHGYRPWVTAPSLLLFTILLTPLVIMPPASLCLGSVDRNLSHGHTASWHTASARFYREFYPVFPKDEQLKVICDGGNLRLITTSRARNAYSYLAFSITTTQSLLTFLTKNRATHGVALLDCQPDQSRVAIY